MKAEADARFLPPGIRVRLRARFSLGGKTTGDRRPYEGQDEMTDEAVSFRDRGSRVLFGVAAGAVAVVAAGLRLYRLDHFSLWLDEIMQSLFIHGSWGQFWSSIRFDAMHPPLDYLIDRFFTFLRPGDAALKLPAVAYGVGAVVALMALIGRRAGAKAGLAASVLLAAAPFHVRYSQELRPYSLGVLLVLASLIALDAFLAKPSVARLAGLYLAVVATAYTLYVAALVLLVAGAGMTIEDAFSRDLERRRHARRFLSFGPLFLVAVAVAYIPWLPVVFAAARAASPTPAPTLTLARFGNVLSFYAFAPNAGHALDLAGFLYAGVAAAGLGVALSRPRLRFLAVWAVAGSAVIEILEQTKPHFFVPRHYLASAVAIPALAGLALASLARVNLLRVGIATFLLALFLAADARGLASYFADGRPDWRPLARYLRERPAGDIVLTENAYALLCVGYYVDGPDFLHLTPEERARARPVLSLQGDPAPIGWLGKPGRTLWLVLSRSGEPSPVLRRFAAPYPSLEFPTAEGGATLKRVGR